MESPTAKVSELFQSDKKLKQGTLPFEIMKISPKSGSSLLKRQKLNSFSKIEEDDIVIINEMKVNARKQNSPLQESFKMEVEEIESSIEPEIVNQVQKNQIETDGIEQGKSNSTEVILFETFKEDNISKNVSAPVNEFKNVNDDDLLKSSKRKLENAENMKEVKPVKRAKLIYNVDKINIIQKVPSISSVNINCSNGKTEQRISKDCSESELGDNLEVVNFKSGHRGSDFDGTHEMSASEEEKNRTDEIQAAIGSVESLKDSTEKGKGNANLKKENSSPYVKNTLKQLTPKQIERKAEIAKRREEIQQERDRKKLEKNRMKQEKKEEKARLKQEKEKVKKKMKEEKEKKKLEEIELKNEERRKKEEEKRKKEEEKQEEKRKKEEQRLEDKRKREEMLKKKEEVNELQKKKFTKEAQAFSSFFKKCDSKTATVREDDGSSNEVVFMPFAVRADMRLAPINRNPMDDDRLSKFEELFRGQSTEILYLEELRSGVIIPRHNDNTWPLEEKYEEVICLDEGLDLNEEIAAGPRKKFNNRRPKLLQFYENRRPPYWGTWRKKSKNVRPKAPLGKDEIFDYEVDSDEEWEEEEPGESLHGSDDEKESEDEYEVDNDFFVPHGYLSDDENPEEEIISPEIQKAKLKLLGEQFDLERNEKTKLLKPLLLGCVWFNSDSDQPASAKLSVVTFLNKRKAVPWTEIIPIPVLQDENTDPAEVMLSDGGTPTSSKESIFPESAVVDLITLIHGSTNSRKNLAKTFLAQWNHKREELVRENDSNVGMLSQARIARKIKELAKWEEFPEEGPIYGKFCWYVKKEVREKFGLSDLLTLQKGDDFSEVRDLDSCKKISPSLITKFTKVLTEDERKNQIMKSRISLMKSVAEFTANTPKQVTPLKCVKKLQQFLAKPSLTSKYFPTVVIDNDDSLTKNDDSEVTLEKTAIQRNHEYKDSGRDKTEYNEAMEIEENHTNVDSTGHTVAGESSKRESSPAPAECNETCDGTLSSEETRNSKGSLNGSQVDSKPIEKKRVAILFSAPRGCDIIKPEVEFKKSEVLMDDVKKNENSIRNEGESSEREC